MALLAALLAGSLLAASSSSAVAPPPPDALREIEIVEHPDALLPLDARFRDDLGQEVALGSFYAPGRPVVLALVYYRCPMLCNLVLNGVVKAVRSAGLDPARDFEVVAISIDPAEGPSVAASKKESYLRALAVPGARKRWHFLTGDAAAIERVATAVGFRYRWDEPTGQWAHAAGIFVTTPEGRVSRTLYGIEYPPRDLRLALVEASQGRVGSSMDRVFLACYDWDRSSGTYTLAAMRLVRIGGGLTVLVLGGALAALWRREARRGLRRPRTT
jgi:protein SCO1/2